jgi:hypothetical protein
MTCNPEDIEIVAGNNSPPVVWTFLETEGPPEVLPGGILERNTIDDPDLVIDIPGASVSWSYSVEDSRAMPKGRTASYELEWRVPPSQATYIGGGVFIGGGINAD